MWNTKQPRIVIAEDDQAVNELLRDMLIDEGYAVIGCYTGNQAMEVIQKEKPDLVIVDMQMEDRYAGLRVFAMMRDELSTVNIPVIICSADNHFLMQRRQDIARLDGEVIYKPFETADVIHTVKRLLGR